jgi:hypothetical protein
MMGKRGSTETITVGAQMAQDQPSDKINANSLNSGLDRNEAIVSNTLKRVIIFFIQPLPSIVRFFNR